MDKSRSVWVIVGLALVALATSAWWMFEMVDPCLGSRISEYFSDKPAEPVLDILGQDVTNLMPATNPYGIKSCDRWIGAPSTAASLTVLAIIAILVGFLSGWLLRRQPLLLAALLTAGSVSLMFTIDFVSWHMQEEPLLVMHPERELIGMLSAIVVLAALLALGSAWLTRRLVRNA